MRRHWHSPSLLAWLLLAVGLLLFVTLGCWQWRRAAEKEVLLAAYAAAATAPPRPFAAVAETPPPGAYPRVAVRGHFLADRAYVLDEQMHEGRVGVMALAVFEPLGSELKLLVNRGWMAWSRAQGTPVALPPPPEGEVELRGLYAPPPGGGLRVGGDALPAQTSWPKLTLYVDLREIAKDLRADVYPRLLLLDAEPASGFVRDWVPAVMPPERHRGYAVQWWSFALASLVIFLALHWRKVSDKS